MTTFRYVEAKADFSPCGQYRYTLSRQWTALDQPGPLFLMLNPSTASHTVDDPTIRRCVGFARDWGHHRMEVCNLFAYRSTNPRVLWDVADPVGPENDRFIVERAKAAAFVVCAWGAHPLAVKRGQVLRALLPDVTLYALKLTREGDPNHPLYLSKLLKPVRFEPRRVEAA